MILLNMIKKITLKKYFPPNKHDLKKKKRERDFKFVFQGGILALAITFMPY
jgi:hypothetical protein